MITSGSICKDVVRELQQYVAQAHPILESTNESTVAVSETHQGSQQATNGRTDSESGQPFCTLCINTLWFELVVMCVAALLHVWHSPATCAAA